MRKTLFFSSFSFAHAQLMVSDTLDLGDMVSLTDRGGFWDIEKTSSDSIRPNFSGGWLSMLTRA